jgi:diamine N-acetyltransferase
LHRVLDMGGRDTKIDIQLGACSLRPMDCALAEELAPALVAIDPWATLKFPASRFITFFTNEDPALRRLAVFVDNTLAGVVCIRQPWLAGPYLNLLAVLPVFQGLHLGREILGWFEAQATANDRWLWIVCSTFNIRAYDFYRAHGYESAATLTQLISDSSDEFLMRKRVVV